jgi:hypothetical protein
MHSEHSLQHKRLPSTWLIPALEALHWAWSSRAECPKYERFADALKSACMKIDEYYEKTTETPAYIMAMSTLLR